MKNDFGYNELSGEIYNYIFKEKNSQAILIDGKWGIGKTYAIKKTIEDFKKNNKEKNYIYISLYGINNLLELKKRILYQQLPEFLTKEYKDSSKFKVLENISKISAFSGVVFDKFADFDKIDYTKLINVTDYIFIFDDLERISMNLIELLGFFNELVEHNNCKILLIANEDEIQKVDSHKNKELKYLVAQNLSHNSSENSTIKIDDMKSNAYEIFSQNEAYQKIKEKLIGLTIKFKPDIEELIDNLIEENSTEFVKKNIPFIKEDLLLYIKAHEVENLRTIIFALNKFNRVVEFILKYEQDENIKKSLSKLLISCCVWSSKDFKDGKKPDNWVGRYGKTEIIVVDKPIYTLKYKCIDEFIRYNFFNETYINDIFKPILQEYKDDEHNKYFNFLYKEWDFYDSNIFVENLENFKKQIYENDYKHEYYPKVIQAMLFLESLDISIDFDALFVKMVENFKNNNNAVEFQFNNVTLSGESKSKYDEKFKILIELNTEIEKNKKQTEIKNLIAYNDQWVKTLDSKVKTGDDFFDILNSEEYNLFLENLNKLTNKELAYFRDLMSSLFSNHSDVGYLKNNKVHLLDKLKTDVTNLVYAETNEIKRAILKLLSMDLERYIEIYNYMHQEGTEVSKT